MATLQATQRAIKFLPIAYQRRGPFKSFGSSCGVDSQLPQHSAVRLPVHLCTATTGCLLESYPPTIEFNPGQVVNTRVPLSSSSIIRYQPMSSDALWLGRSGVTLVTCKIVTVIHLWTEGLGEMSTCLHSLSGVVYTSPYFRCYWRECFTVVCT